MRLLAGKLGIDTHNLAIYSKSKADSIIAAASPPVNGDLPLGHGLHKNHGGEANHVIVPVKGTCHPFRPGKYNLEKAQADIFRMNRIPFLCQAFLK